MESGVNPQVRYANTQAEDDGVVWNFSKVVGITNRLSSDLQPTGPKAKRREMHTKRDR